MAFPFPTNPRNGQRVNYTNSKGLLMVATYNSVKNEWEVETALPPSTVVTGTPEINVSPSADGQVIAWDDTLKTWVAKTLAYKTQDLTDVATAIVPTNGQVLKYVAARNQYEPTLIGSDVWQATADQVAAQTGATDADKVAAVHTLLNPGGIASEGSVLLVSAGNALNAGLVGSWYYTGSVWVLGASGGGTGPAKPTINYRPDSATPQAAGVLTGDLDVVTETNNHQLNVYDGTLYQAVFRESIVKQWIAAGSLFQGAVDAKAELLNLPAADVTNKGFYWTWTGPGSTDVAPTDFPGGLGFTSTLQVGDWIQSDGTKYIHVPSDLLSKLRWEGVGSFKTWYDTNWEKDSLVRHQNKFYRAKQAVTTGAVAPDVTGSLWDNITPTYSLGSLTDVDTSANTNLDNKFLVYDGLNGKWIATTVNLNDLSNVYAANRSNSTPLDTGDILFYHKPTNTWRVNNLAVIAGDHLTIGDLSDFNVTGLTDGDYLVYDGTAGHWKNTPTVRARVEFLSDVGDVEINSIPDPGEALAWAGTKWVPTKVGGMGEWKAGNTYAQNSLVLHKKAVWLATAEILPGNEPGGTNTNSNLWKKETGTTLRELDDVDVPLPGNGNFLRYFNGKWINQAVGLKELSDTNIGVTPTEGQSLVYKSGKWVNSTPTAVSQTTVGDIKQSILTETQFKAQMGADGGGWVLADGRNVVGSTYATLTGQANVPDLRGAYLRMAGQSSRDTGWNGGTLNAWQEDTTRIPRNTQLTGTTNSTGGHTHNLWSRRMNAYSGAGYSPAAQTVGEGISAGGVTNVSGRWMDSDGAHSHTTTVTGGGDAETKPKTYSVNYFIKVN